MPLVPRLHESGLMVAEESMDERAITAAIKQINPRYVLYKAHRDVAGGWVYKVVYNWSDEHDAIPVLTWMDDYGNARPLSSGIIELVQKHQLGARNVDDLSAEDYHREYERRITEEADALGREIVREHAPRLKGRVQVSLAHKQRKQQWQKENGGRIKR